MKILFLAPHLSTGGMPAFLLKRIESLQQYTSCEIFVVEYQCYSLEYTVQRNKIIELIGKDNFYSLTLENKTDIFPFIDMVNPDIIHIDEMSERLNPVMIKLLYHKDRPYHIIETCHDISFNPQDKIYIPDAFAFCTPYHMDTFKDVKGYKEVIEFPIDNKHTSDIVRKQSREFLNFFPSRYHVINVGLWTPGKNQAEGIEIAKKYPKYMFHFIGNQAENFRDYWEPLMQNLPDNVKVWGERTDIDVFMKAADIFMFNSINECNPIVLKEAISYKKYITARKLPQYLGMYNNYISGEPLLNPVLKSYEVPTNNTSQHFASNHLNLYKKTMETPIEKEIDKYQIIQHFVGQPFLEITGKSDSDFRVEFYDADTELLLYSNTIKCNHWIKVNREYYTRWRTIVYKDDIKIYDDFLVYANQKVYIAFESKSLGDTLAWIPYVEEFRLKHNCKVVCSTYNNELFETYPNIEFVSPGTTVHNIYGMYSIGWFYNENKEPELPNTIPLQKTASNILGLEYKEIKPEIIKPYSVPSTNKYVTIATNSTAGCKFWTKENWQEVITYLHQKGYIIVNTSLEENPFENCVPLYDKSLKNTIYQIYNSDFFIGLSSGLSWLAWALNKEVIMISNFTEDWHEFSCHRPIEKSICHGCWNNKNFKFDKGDWDWCPIHRGTDRQFECQKAITSNMIITLCDELINFKSTL